jgi:hypothetical protein
LSDIVLREGRSSHFILFWKCLQQLQLVSFNLSLIQKTSIEFFGILCWVLAVQVDLCGLWTYASLIEITYCSFVHGQPEQ